MEIVGAVVFVALLTTLVLGLFVVWAVVSLFKRIFNLIPAKTRQVTLARCRYHDCLTHNPQEANFCARCGRPMWGVSQRANGTRVA